MNKQPKIDINKVKAELCRRSLFYFLKEFWEIINKKDFDYNWHIEYLCEEVQLIVDKYVLGRESEIEKNKWYEGFGNEIKKNLIVNVPPGTTKSTIVTRMACAWIWCIDSSKSQLTSTIDGTNANQFSMSTLDIIRSDKYQLYFPEVKLRKEATAKKFYQSVEGGLRYSLTTRGSSTGKHVDIIIDDDPMDYKTAIQPNEAKECIEGFKALQTRKKDKEKVPYILVMQRLSTHDTTAHALKALNDVKHICLPAEDLYNNIKPEALRRYYIDGLLNPIGLSKSILEDIRKGLSDESKPISDIAYNIQFNQVSQSVEGLMYPNLNFVPSLPENRNDITRLSITDVADTGSDYFATWLVEINMGRIYIFDAIYTQDGSQTTSERLQTNISVHGTVINKMESNNQGSVYVSWLQSRGVNIQGYNSSGNKQVRISSFAQFVHQIYFVDPSTHTNQEYRAAVKHVQAFPKQGKSEDGHDDAEDALTEVLMYIYTNWRYLLVTN